MKRISTLIVAMFITAIYAKAAITFHTISAISITTSSAEIKFSISNSTAPYSTNMNIYYGTTSGSLTSSLGNVAYSGANVTNVTRSITGLLQGTTYYYQLKSGTTTSSISSFTTTSLPINVPTISNVSTTVGNTSFNVAYTLLANYANTTSQINYGTASTNLNLNVAGHLANNTAANTAVTGNTTINTLALNTKYYYTIAATNSAGTTTTAIDSFTTLLAALSPVVSLNNTVPLGTTSNIFYNVTPNYATTTPTFMYGLAASNLNVQVSVTNVLPNNNNNMQQRMTTLNGLTANTKYYYKIFVTNTAGADTSAIDSFITQNNNIGLVREFKFNNSRYDETKSYTFNGTSGYTMDRFGNANSAKICVNGQADKTLFPDIPTVANARSFSIWFKNNSFSAAVGYPFFYGLLNAYMSYGLSMNANTAGVFLYHPSGLDPKVNTTTSANVWHHAVVTTDATGTHKLYIDGALKLTQQMTPNTTGKDLYVGYGNFDGAVDDLLVYSGALDSNQVVTLFNNNTTLPTTITNLYATKKDNATLLNWTSENEVNVAHFNIQYGTNGSNFETIGKVYATLKSNYSFINPSASNNSSVAYYRLQIVDKNGTCTYSKIIKVLPLLKQDFNVQLQSNVVKNNAILYVNTTSTKLVNVSVCNSLGAIVKAVSKQVAIAGSSSLNIDLSSLSNGFYFITTNDNAENIITQKILKN